MFGRTKRLVGGGRRDQRCRLERQEGLAASGRMCLVGGGATMTAHMEQREVLAAGSNPALLDLKKAYSTSRLRVILQRLTTGEFLNHSFPWSYIGEALTVTAMSLLVYVSREKHPGFQHHKKVGAMRMHFHRVSLLFRGEGGRPCPLAQWWKEDEEGNRPWSHRRSSSPPPLTFSSTKSGWKGARVYRFSTDWEAFARGWMGSSRMMLGYHRDQYRLQ